MAASPTFLYKATAADGTRDSGSIEARSETAARSALVARGLDVGDVKEKRGFLKFELRRARIPREQIMNFSRQLAAFVRAGIPLVSAIETMASETASSPLGRILVDVADALRRGEAFSASIQRHGRAFPPVYVDMLKAAETTGRLDEVLDQLSGYIERDQEARRAIKGALVYPAIVAVMSIATVLILTVFVLPRFEKFFASMHAKLPGPTRLLLTAAALVGQWWWAGLAIAAFFIGSTLFAVRRPRGRYARDRVLLRLPVVGEVVRFALVERFCRTLSSMVSAGVGLPEALGVVANGANNVVYERALTHVRNEMMSGEGFARPIADSGLFPATVVQMVKAGEETGTLDLQLRTAASFYAQELGYRIKRLTTLFEPAIIVFMGLIVGFVAIALVEAMYGIFKSTGTM